ncbi:uncharacterized protein LOC111705074 [Eurytemora carolleeae]|uniref:uncharacterized protein LOC111705074 n=1 Tax=Eurytemora carolleeae TaxID=1294199 RepID=UPI000C7615F3|nr:uncharacterized protein LOC111705074 [Eurytemora carolleeae]XP_023333284.1 uncharacterized protein LOC111705074 [Eurytemora carolleeae]|eukprot:XP_023333279.1 uncharacterized protein LOC111705074 [Eurytemora affinis]
MVLRDTTVFTLLFILNLEISPGTTDLLTWNGDNTLLNDEVPWRNLSQLSQLERSSRFNLTVIILTMNRPESLRRLLDSIDKTFFEFSEDKLNLEIHVDKSQGWFYDDCVNIAKNYSLPPGRGTVKPKIFSKNHGLRAAWFESWTPNSISDHAIIIEDDLEVSPLWFSWLRRSWLTYRHRTDLAGIALSRQYMVVQKPDRDFEIENDGVPFLYRLVGTWGFSPHPARWVQLLTWFNSLDSETFDPYVPGLITSDWLHIHTRQGRRHMTWEQWHVFHSNKENLFTLYLNLGSREVLVNNWREAGVHSRTSPNQPDYPLLQSCPIQLQEFPAKLRKYNWNAEEILE